MAPEELVDTLFAVWTGLGAAGVEAEAGFAMEVLLVTAAAGEAPPRP